MEKRIYLLIYASDYSSDMQSCGPETKLRIERAVSFITANNQHDFTVLFTAGRRKYQPEALPFKSLMKEYFIRYFQQVQLNSSTQIPQPAIMCPTANYWSTFEETVAADQILTDHRCDSVTIVSSRYHILRIKLIWELVSNKRITCIAAPSVFLKNIVLEPIKLLKVFYDFIRKHHMINRAPRFSS